jgi:hypothetical protein
MRWLILKLKIRKVRQKSLNIPTRKFLMIKLKVRQKKGRKKVRKKILKVKNKILIRMKNIQRKYFKNNNIIKKDNQ